MTKQDAVHAEALASCYCTASLQFVIFFFFSNLCLTHYVTCSSNVSHAETNT